MSDVALDEKACAQTSLADHIARFWHMIEDEPHVRILVNVRRDTSSVPYWDSSSFPNDVAKAIAAERRASPSQVAPQPQAGEAVAAGGLYGPFGWLNGCRGLSEDSWELESDPLENSDEYFAIPLYALTDPFKEVGPLYASPQAANPAQGEEQTWQKPGERAAQGTPADEQSGETSHVVNPAQVTDAVVEHMVLRFLRWKLPDDFNPDGGIAFDPIINMGTESQSRREPVGTNLLDYRQAKAMVQHMLDGLAAIGAGGQAVAEDATISEMVRAYNRTTDYIFPQATDKEQREAMRAVYATLFQLRPADERTCTCHPDDNPPSPCAEKYALSECCKAADERVVEALDDTKRFDKLRDESWDLRCFDIPTGGDDYDIGWRVVGHWMAEPRERTIAEVYHDDPRAAIDEAISSLSKSDGR